MFTQPVMIRDASARMHVSLLPMRFEKGPGILILGRAEPSWKQPFGIATIDCERGSISVSPSLLPADLQANPGAARSQAPALAPAYSARYTQQGPRSLPPA